MSTGLDLSRIACISIATHDIDRVLPNYTDGLGYEVTRERQSSPRGYGLRWIELGAGGRTLFELMEPTGEGGPVDRFLKYRTQGGVYQVRLQVRDLDQALTTLSQRGLRTIRGKDVPGVPNTGWIHPESTGGMLLELVELE